MASVTVHFPHMPDGEPMEVVGLGVFANGTTTELSEAQVQTFEANTGRKFPEDSNLVASSDPEYGSLLEPTEAASVIQNPPRPVDPDEPVVPVEELEGTPSVTEIATPPQPTESDLSEDTE